MVGVGEDTGTRRPERERLGEEVSGKGVGAEARVGLGVSLKYSNVAHYMIISLICHLVNFLTDNHPNSGHISLGQ